MKLNYLLTTVFVYLCVFFFEAQDITQLNVYYSSMDSRAKATYVTENQTSYIAGEYSGEIILGFNYHDAQLKNSIYFSKQFSNGDIPFMKTFSGTEEVFVSSIISKGNEVIIGGTFTDSLFIGEDTLVNLDFKGIYIAVFDTLGNHQYSLEPESYSAELYDLTYSNEGDLLITGEYFGVFDFGGYSLNAPLGFNMYLIKYNLSQQLVEWVKSSTGTATNGKSVRVDGTGYSYVVGSYGDATTFDGQGLSSVTGDHNLYVVKYSDLGDLVWIRTITGLVQTHGLGLAVSNLGDVYVSGEFEMYIDIPQVGTIFNGGLMDAFISKLNSNGDFIWGKGISSPDNDRGVKIVLDINQNPILLANTGSIIDFNGVSLNSGGFNDPLLLKLNKFDGSYIWHCRIPSAPISGIVAANSISIYDNVISVCGTNRTGIFYQEEVIDSPNLDDTFWAFIKDTNNAEINVSSIKQLIEYDLTCFPNPFSEYIKIQADEIINSVAIFDARSLLIMTLYPKSKELLFEEKLLSGIYHFKIETEKSTHHYKLLKL